MDVAIIGGGIAGLVLALTLQKRSVKCTIYELRETSDIANPGAVAIAPNGVRLLDKLGLLEEVRAVSWPLEEMQFRDQQDNLFSTVDMGGQNRYGYSTQRVVRRKLHDVLLAAVHSAGIPIISGKKFSRIVSTTPSSVTFAFTDDTQCTASVLVGADGMHSAVRRTFIPDAQPEYNGNLTVAAKISSNPLLRLPPSEELESRLHSIAVTLGVHGSSVIIVQSTDGEEVAVAIDTPYPEQVREDWDSLLQDHQKQYELLMEDYDTWPETVQMFLREVKVEDMYRSWPFYALPDLKEWSTPERTTVLIGDAAHAIPPSGGQGACQAIEDAWSLGVTLGLCQGDPSTVGSDGFQTRILNWQTERRKRVDLVRTMTKKMGNARLPVEMREKLPPSEMFTSNDEAGRDLNWLYGYDCDSHV